MKRWVLVRAKRLICAVLAAGLFCSVAGCQKKSGLPKPTFPLEKAVVTAAVEQLGLPWDISDDETQSGNEDRSSYTLRHKTEEVPASGSKRTTAGVTGALIEGERCLSGSFLSYDSPVNGERAFAWTDWKQQIVLTTLLYGGFADEEELYRVFSAMDIAGAKVDPTGEVQQDTIYEWGAQFSGAYCRVSYRTGGDNSSHVILSVSIYESEARYQKLRQEGLAAVQKERERVKAVKDARSKVSD